MSQKKLIDDYNNDEILEVISLDEMDGFEFQQFTAHLFSKLGYGSVEEIRQVSDE